MLGRIDHIAIAVEDLEEAIAFFEKAYGLACISKDVVGDTKAAFLPIGETRLELVQSIIPDGAVAKYINSRGEGIHHLAFQVDDIRAVLNNLASLGIRLIDREPRPGAHDTEVAFVHPKSNHGILMELVQHR